MFTSKTAVLFMIFLFEVTTSVSGNLSFMHSLNGSRVGVVLCISFAFLLCLERGPGTGYFLLRPWSGSCAHHTPLPLDY